MGSSAGHGENQHFGAGRASAAARYFFAPLIPLGILLCLKKVGACLSTFPCQSHSQGIIMMLIANAAGNKPRIGSVWHPVAPRLTGICTQFLRLSPAPLNPCPH